MSDQEKYDTVRTCKLSDSQKERDRYFWQTYHEVVRQSGTHGAVDPNLAMEVALRLCQFVFASV